jgi:hypothetical protein
MALDWDFKVHDGIYIYISHALSVCHIFIFELDKTWRLLNLVSISYFSRHTVLKRWVTSTGGETLDYTYIYIYIEREIEFRF